MRVLGQKFTKIALFLRRFPGKRSRSTSGVTLVELMIATAVLAIGAVGLIGSFLSIQRAAQVAKNKTLAASLAQEQQQILSQMSYGQVLVTQNPSYNSNYSPTIPYDTQYFPPQTLTESNVQFTRYTYVQVVTEQANGVIQQLPPTTADTGLRQITVTVVWTESGGQNKKLTVNSLLANPNTVTTNSNFYGTVYSSSGSAPVAGVTVDIAENLGWLAVTNAAGYYSIGVAPGSYTMAASAHGYFSQLIQTSIAANQNDLVNIYLVPMASAPVAGTAWMNTNLVISEVVGSSKTYVNGNTALGTFDVQYVELFNPTSYYINVITTGSAAGPWYPGTNATERYKINVANGANNFTALSDIVGCSGSNCVYVSTAVPPGGYFLIGSFQSMYLGGHWVTSDAYFTGNTNCGGLIFPLTAPTCIPKTPFGAVQLQASGGTTVDQVCWNGATGPPSSAICTSPYLQTDPNCGLETGTILGTCVDQGDQLVRLSTMNYLARGIIGSAYDTGYSTWDFVYPQVNVSSTLPTAGNFYAPFTTQSSTLPVAAGVPAVGAFVSASDSLSSTVQVNWTVAGGSATFTIPYVATGTWSVFISSRGYMLENDTVTVYATAMSTPAFVFPSSTTILSTTDASGFVSGTVTDYLGNPISLPVPILVTPSNGASVQASVANGQYFLRVGTGTINVTANSGNVNGNYVSVSSVGVSVLLGRVTNNISFTLTEGGRITGYVTRDGINALPGIAVAAIDAGGNPADTEITNNSGSFTTVNIATGTYTIQPQLDDLETTSPSYVSVTVGQGQTAFSSTFTVTGALGTISGSVSTAGGAPISSGVLIFVTTTTMSLPPTMPTLSSATLTSSAVYAVSSLENGTYTIGVRQSTSPPYNIYASYSTVSSSGVPNIQYSRITGVPVVAGSTSTGNNFTW